MNLWLAPWICRFITGVQARWQGCVPDGRQRIYFANHTSNLDFLILWSLLPMEYRAQTRPVAAHDYWTGSPVRHFLADKVFNAVLIERKKVTRTNNPLVTMGQALEAGSSLIIFPEGGRKKTDAPGMLPFKSGLHHLATRHPGVELIPVYIRNMNRILPAGEVLFVPLICSATFGAPFHRVEGESKDDFLRRAEAAVKETETS
jgi:1-acyl-sn-glycerol-3-phosphate acyltransferase